MAVLSHRQEGGWLFGFCLELVQHPYVWVIKARGFATVVALPYQTYSQMAEKRRLNVEIGIVYRLTWQIKDNVKRNWGLYEQIE